MSLESRENLAPSELREEERQRCEVWTRVMGYHRPVSSFNIGKQGEHRERQFFDESAVGTTKRAALEAALVHNAPH